MNSFSYTAFIDRENIGYNNCSRELVDESVFVNCTGFMSLDKRFTTINEPGRDDYYLMYIISGRLEFEIGDKIFEGKSGDFVIYPPRTRYKYVHKEDEPLSYYFVHFTGYYVAPLLEKLSLLPCDKVWHRGLSERISRAFSDLFAAFNSDGKYKFERSGAITEVILTTLAEFDEAEGERAPIHKSLSYINSFYTDKISVPDLARMDNLSVSRYNTLFKRIIGISPTKYIMGLRINYASTLLSSTDMDIGEIGEIVGYSDKHFFSRVFKEYMGKTPREYRNTARAYAKEKA